MTTSIEIVQRDEDKTCYLVLIVKLLNKYFTSPESMELHWGLNCLEVAQELDGRLIVEKNYVVFDFTYSCYS